MKSKQRCEDFIKLILKNGGQIISEKKEISTSLSACITILLYKDCYIKISYLNLGLKQIVVQKDCCCNFDDWRPLLDECFKNKMIIID